MTGIDNDKSWGKRPPWKQPKHNRDKKKSHKTTQSLKRSLHIASRKEWQLDCDTPNGTSQYYSIVKKDLYIEKYSNPLKSLISSGPHYIFGKLSQRHTDHGVLETHLQKRPTRYQSHHCQCDSAGNG